VTTKFYWPVDGELQLMFSSLHQT